MAAFPPLLHPYFARPIRSKEEMVLASLRQPRIMPLYWITCTILIIAADHLTDPYIHFPILFLVPVTLASVYNG
jgi:hypothetical protein